MNIHYNKNFADLNNIDKLDTFGDTSHKLIRKENIYLLRQNLEDYVNRQGKQFWGYFRVQKNQIERKDSFMGGQNTFKKSEFIDGFMTPFHSVSTSDLVSTSRIFTLEFEVNNQGRRYVREVYNFQKVMIMIGGSFCAMFVIFSKVLQPIISDQLPLLVASDTIIGR